LTCNPKFFLCSPEYDWAFWAVAAVCINKEETGFEQLVKNVLERELEREIKKKKEAKMRENYVATFEAGKNHLFRLWLSRG